ncbi:MAG: DUF47 domain-containing protein [Clostridia bacterium]|nr:DUF47 domain-containing protein [Clostridia bacterium]
MAKKENNYYFDTFAKGISCSSDAAVMLKKSIENYDPSNISERMEKIHEIEHIGDKLKHDMMERLVKEFLPPIEREDIVELASAIDDVTDCIEDVVRCMYMFNITEIRSDAIDFSDVVQRCCQALKEMGSELHNFRKSTQLKDKIIEINHLEEEGDRLYTMAVRKLYTEEQDPVSIASWTAVYDKLEKCCDSCEDVADMVEQIIMKNS